MAVGVNVPIPRRPVDVNILEVFTASIFTVGTNTYCVDMAFDAHMLLLTDRVGPNIPPIDIVLGKTDTFATPATFTFVEYNAKVSILGAHRLPVTPTRAPDGAEPTLIVEIFATFTSPTFAVETKTFWI